VKTADVLEAIGYATAGIFAASRGDFVTAARCFILAATCFVDPDTSAQYLTEANVNRANMIADVSETVKFGRLS
jgi:hypothetical protein